MKNSGKPSAEVNLVPTLSLILLVGISETHTNLQMQMIKLRNMECIQQIRISKMNMLYDSKYNSDHTLLYIPPSSLLA